MHLPSLVHLYIHYNPPITKADKNSTQERKAAITEGESSGIKIMIEIGVAHMRDRTEIEGTVEALVTVVKVRFKGDYK